MNNIEEHIRVSIWGKEMGILSWNPKTWVSTFHFADDWKSQGLDISPIIYPLESFPREKKFIAHGSKSGFFGRLPHFLADYMPKFRHVHRYNPDPAQRLLLAPKEIAAPLTFTPAEQSPWATQYSLDDPVVIKHVTMKGRSKKTFVLRDGVEYIRKEGKNAKQEYEYYLKALDAGIRMSESFCEYGAFYTRRFDRLPDGTPLYAQTLSAIDPKALSYSALIEVCRKLNLGDETVDQCLRLLAFNTLIQNDDDNNRNISFLMTPEGRWSMAPAYDLSYCHNPDKPNGPNKYRLAHDIPMEEIPSEIMSDVKWCIGG